MFDIFINRACNNQTCVPASHDNETNVAQLS